MIVIDTSAFVAILNHETERTASLDMAVEVVSAVLQLHSA
jgi:uncharacterized protein with PIN domain